MLCEITMATSNYMEAIAILAKEVSRICARLLPEISVKASARLALTFRTLERGILARAG
jgi:hypothetical protein